jgi:hypothetical protein
VRGLHIGLAVFWALFGTYYVVRAESLADRQASRRTWQLGETGYRVLGVLGLFIACIWLAVAVAD